MAKPADTVSQQKSGVAQQQQPVALASAPEQPVQTAEDRSVVRLSTTSSVARQYSPLPSTGQIPKNGFTATTWKTALEVTPHPGGAVLGASQRGDFTEHEEAANSHLPCLCGLAYALVAVAVIIAAAFILLATMQGGNKRLPLGKQPVNATWDGSVPTTLRSEDRGGQRHYHKAAGDNHSSSPFDVYERITVNTTAVYDSEKNFTLSLEENGHSNSPELILDGDEPQATKSATQERFK